jgi:hypothetical protein
VVAFFREENRGLQSQLGHRRLWLARDFADQKAEVDTCDTDAAGFWDAAAPNSACSIRVSTRAFVRIWRIVRKRKSRKFFVFNNQQWSESHPLRQPSRSFSKFPLVNNLRSSIAA